MLRERLLTAALLIPVIAVAFLLGRAWLIGLVLLISILAADEMFALLGRDERQVLPLPGIVFAVAITASGIRPQDPFVATSVVAAGVVLVALAAFGHREPGEGMEAWVRTTFGAVYVGLLASLVRIIQLDVPVPAGAPLASLDSGRAWLVVLIAGVWAFDSAAYAAGRLLGRHRFMEHISPKKTWEGVVGGVVGATAVTVLTLWAVGRSPAEALALGPLIAVTAQAGDLAESLVKRAAGAKDSGTLFPGHGGILDRVDSFLFAGPAVAVYVAVIFR